MINIKKIMQNMWDQAMILNKKNILGLLEVDSNCRLLDLGCDDGDWSLELGRTIITNNIYGIDIVEASLKKAELKGIRAKKADLNKSLPFRNNYFDCIHANQVIEHLVNVDLFLSDMYRILKKGGYCIISTENLSSWCNILSLFFGWQPFSNTNISERVAGIGNPLALHRGKKIILKSWMHMRVISIHALEEFFEAHKFKIEKIIGAGYFPFPPYFGRFDSTHAHFITIKARKI